MGSTPVYRCSGLPAKKQKLIVLSILQIAFIIFLFSGCNPQPGEEKHLASVISSGTETSINIPHTDSTWKTIHVLVALCDNKYQGIVPVPEKIGNGQDPDNNLYWGCAYGIRTFFKNSSDWKLVSTRKHDSVILERLVFKHATKNWYLVADAYNGKHIRECTEDFLN